MDPNLQKQKTILNRNLSLCVWNASKTQTKKTDSIYECEICMRKWTH